MKVAVLIDGGHLRALAREARLTYDPDFIERVAHACVEADETLLRALYCDCAPDKGTVRKPVSGEPLEFAGSDAWLRNLASRDPFAVRQGVLKFRGFKPKRIPVAGATLSDDDFKPDFEQKGVDMRIGLDMANLANGRTVDRIILVTGDADCIPAMKNGRIAGLQVVIVELANHHLAPELLWHADIKRRIAWPT